MDYPQILAPVLNFLQCPTPQAWIDKARDPTNLPLLLTDHMVCELKAAQTALLLVRKYVADESGADALLDWLKPYEQFTFRDGPEPDFIALHRRIGKSVMPKTDDPWGQALIDSMVLLSGAYDGVKAQAWLENWQGLKHAIETRQHIEIEHFRNEAISQEPFWLHSGKR